MFFIYLILILLLNEKSYSVPITTYNDKVINISGGFNNTNKPNVYIQNKICEVFEYSSNNILCYLNKLDGCTNEIIISYNDLKDDNGSTINYSKLVCPEKPNIEKLIINYDEKRKHTSFTIAGNKFPTYNPILKFSLNNNIKKLNHERQIFEGSVPSSLELKCSGPIEFDENYIVCNSTSNDLYNTIRKSDNHHYIIISPNISTIYNNNQNNDTIINNLLKNTILIKQISTDNIHKINKRYKSVAFISIPSFILVVLIIIMSILIHKKNKKPNKKL